MTTTAKDTQMGPGTRVEVMFCQRGYISPFGTVTEANGTLRTVELDASRLDGKNEVTMNVAHLREVDPDGEQLRVIVTDVVIRRRRDGRTPRRTIVYPSYDERRLGVRLPYTQYERTDETGPHVTAAKRRSLAIARDGIRHALRDVLDLTDDEIGALKFDHRAGCPCGCSPGFIISPAVLGAKSVSIQGHVVSAAYRQQVVPLHIADVADPGAVRPRRLARRVGDHVQGGRR